MSKRLQRILRAGSLLATASLWMGGMAEAASWTARGNEPGWQIELSESAIAFTSMEGETLTVQPVPEPVRGEGIEVYSGRAGDELLTLVAVDKVCTDTMSGMPHPKSVVVTIGERVLVGCGGDPLSLLLGDWRVEEIAGQPVKAQSEPSIGFELDGSMHGNASCNRFFGGFTLTGEGLTLSPGGATMMACDNDTMDQEQRFLAALEEVGRFESQPDGALRLLDAAGNAALIARR